jgi:hypothetical protein
VDIATGVFVNCHCATHISSCPIRNALWSCTVGKPYPLNSFVLLINIPCFS